MNDLLKIVADYADQVAAAERRADADLSVIRAFDALYESREWVDEWLAESPEPKRRSNNWKPDSKSRFAGWLRWKLEQQGKPVFGWNYTYKNLAAGEVVRRVPTLYHGTKLTERTLRPLTWALKNRYEDRLPEIAAMAVATAGSVDALTSTTARKAVAEWKQEEFGRRRDGTPRTGTGTNQAAAAAAKANRIRLNMLDEIAELYDLAGRNPKALDEFNGLLRDLEVFLTEKRAIVA
jgi:hypothetical protein